MRHIFGGASLRSLVKAFRNAIGTNHPRLHDTERLADVFHRCYQSQAGAGRRQPGGEFLFTCGSTSADAVENMVLCVVAYRACSGGFYRVTSTVMKPRLSPPTQRDHANALAKSNPKHALDQARKVTEPWFRAQALSWVARFTDGDPVAVALEAAKAAQECEDDYKRSAVRAWEIAALAERDCTTKARESLVEALALGCSVEPKSSRSEGLLLLLQAAFRIGRDEAGRVYEMLKASCPVDEHWRCSRAVRDGAKMISGELEPRSFFW